MSKIDSKPQFSHEQRRTKITEEYIGKENSNGAYLVHTHFCLTIMTSIRTLWNLPCNMIGIITFQGTVVYWIPTSFMINTMKKKWT
jgi:hypothetical protein